MPIAEATGAMGNTSCLGGTPEQVARALLEYYKLGIHSFLIRGFDPFEDTVDFGRELIPRLRLGADGLDRAKAAGEWAAAFEKARPAGEWPDGPLAACLG